jgi:MFS family permease
VVLVLVWSQVHSLEAFYALWLAIGLVMAAVLYEPAFAVLAKWFPDAEERRRAMTAMTLVAALASFIFLPLTQALIDAHGWRHALVILAVILGVITVPLHGLILRSATVEPRAPTGQGTELSIGAGEALRSAAFWRLSGAFFLATVTGIAMTVHAIPFLLQRGYGAGFAAFAVGLVGLSQIPGRVLFVALAGRLPRAQATAGVFLLIAAGIALIVSVDASSAVLAGLVLLGMGNGMATLARATAIADIYGAGAYGTIAGVTGAMTTAARGVGPVTAALWATAVGYSALLWTLVVLSMLAAGLAYRAESG